MKTERFVWHEPIRAKPGGDNRPTGYENVYIEMDAVRTDSCLVEISEINRIVYSIKKNFIKRLIYNVNNSSTLCDVVGYLEDELKEIDSTQDTDR